ncbi:Sec34-like family-domain-containing protein [Morchella snyderi]|nr:Sec34-like family-domain-containing protein [Morchella snyderi]
MFEDHWYQHSAPPVPEAPKMRRQESIKKQSPARPSLERTASNLLKKSTEQQQNNSAPEIPIATIPRRPKSYGDLRVLAQDKFVLPGIKGDVNHDVRELPPRPKSRNDLEGARIARYGHKASNGTCKGAIITREIKDELDFADWYKQFEDDLQGSNSEYQLFHSTLQSHLTTCNSLISTTDTTLSLLNTLQSSFRTVHAQTSTFQETCSSLLSHQFHLEKLLYSISTALHPFTELEPVTRLLARPGSDFVKTPAFREMLVRLDDCISWMDDPAHKSFHDVETYAPKFRQCMTRALTLIRNYFVSSIREVSNEVTGRIKERQMNDTTQSALLYAKFRVNAPLLRELVGEIEKRCDHEEYKLIGPIIYKRMTELSAPTNTKNKELVPFARSGISFVRSICMDEFELFYAYFSGEQGDSEVYTFLESLCEPLYDHLRPRIIHETQLVKLCELCTLIQTRYMRDIDDLDTEPYDRTQLDFGQIIQPTLHDTQSRIVFRAQTIIRDEIEGFTPKPEDLDYPTKFQSPSREGTASPNAQKIIDRHDDPAGTNSNGGFDTEAAYKGWYPTLRKCIWLLSRIYRLVNSTVFDDLAHTIVHLTTISLLRASQQLTQRKTPADGHLFLIRHFLLLKEQIVTFDIEFVKPDTQIDFSGLAGSFWELREKGIFSRTGILNLVKGAAMPKVVENMLDAKVELDARLRTVIGEFTKHFADRMTNGIDGPSNRIRAAAGTDPAAEVRAAVEREVVVLRAKLVEYIEDGRTRETLVGAVQELVIQAYESYYESTFLSGNRRPSSGGVIWDVETFVGWSNDVFGVGLGLLGFDEQEGSEDGSPDRSRTGSL